MNALELRPNDTAVLLKIVPPAATSLVGVTITVLSVMLMPSLGRL
jgi:hypothetical protein